MIDLWITQIAIWAGCFAVTVLTVAIHEEYTTQRQRLLAYAKFDEGMARLRKLRRTYSGKNANMEYKELQAKLRDDLYKVEAECIRRTRGTGTVVTCGIILATIGASSLYLGVGIIVVGGILSGGMFMSKNSL